MLQLFRFKSKEVRCLGTWEAPEWVANDVIDVLYPDSDKRNRSNYLKKVPQKWKGHKQIMTPTGLQDVATLRKQPHPQGDGADGGTESAKSLSLLLGFNVTLNRIL